MDEGFGWAMIVSLKCSARYPESYLFLTIYNSNVLIKDLSMILF